ncbi:Neuronal acetylcholine receptor subunit alpha-7 [Holothuria leucospilota]|uniref:Neuronal acetylcholine receptor subunit alpha-7 n=1 Tax=Holothuria leucospilota TaxID=206669 RepID=A0A9Q0YQ87_HOLLE|nr:Neuronal acetylcholine receptor subunit alpha-7 [Holothuria leucospilota]
MNRLDNDVLKAVSPDRGSIHLAPTGDIYFTTPLIVSTQCFMQIRYFPFDTQICVISLTPEYLNVKLQEFSFPSTITSLEWNLLNTTLTIYDTGHFSTPTFCFVLQRDPRYYVSTIIIPSTVMCLLALATFLAPPDCGERLSLGISMVLGLTVFQLLIADSLPTSSKQIPILSNFLSFNFHVACLTVPFSLISINLAHRDTPLNILQYHRMRKVFLHYLPRCMAVPSRGEKRLKGETKTAFEVNTMGKGRVRSAKVQPVVVQTELRVQPNTPSVHEDQFAQVMQNLTFP